MKQGLLCTEVYKIYSNISLSHIYAINTGKTWFDENESYPLNNRKGKSILNNNQKENIKKDFKKLVNLIGKMESYKQLAKKYNCSSRTVSRIVNEGED